MDKAKILKRLFSEKTKDYTFFSLFFLIFAIFVVFAIKPSLTTAFSLKKEAEDLEKVDALYEQVVRQIVDTQTLLEQNRDKLFLLQEAIPLQPQVNKVIKDIEEIASSGSVLISKANISEISLLGNKKDFLQIVGVNIEATSNFDNLISFMKALFNQRRLKTIKKIIILKETTPESSDSSQLKFNLETESYYL